MPGFTLLKRPVFLLLALCCLHTPLAHATLIGLQPGTVFSGTGDSIALDLVVSGLGSGGPDSLGAFDISVAFDPAVLAFTGYSLGGFLGDVGLAEAIDASAGAAGGAVSLAEVSLLTAPELDALQPGAFILATLEFDVINLAASTVTQLSVLSGAVLGDAFGSSLAVTGLGSASIVGVPVPGTLYLLTASLLGWRVMRVRQPL
jgi:hypothetical protein